MVYGICHTGLLTASEQDQFEKLVHLVGFIIRIYHDARSSKHQIMVVYNMLQYL